MTAVATIAVERKPRAVNIYCRSALLEPFLPQQQRDGPGLDRDNVQLQTDDFVYFPSHEWRRSYFWPNCRPYADNAKGKLHAYDNEWLIPLAITRKYANAVDTFRAMARPLSHYGRMVALQVLPTDQGLTLLIGAKLDPRWHHVTIRYRMEELQTYEVCFYRHDISSRECGDDCHLVKSDDTRAEFTLSATLATFKASYRHLMRPQASIALRITPDVNKEWRARGSMLDGWYAHMHVNTRQWTLLTFDGYFETMLQQAEALRNRMEQWCSSESYELWLSHADNLFAIADRKRGLFVQQSAPQAQRRSPWLYKQICTFYLALIHFDVPPYALLEIVDWLPGMHRWSHKQKIDCIIGVHKSIQRVLARREQQSSKARQ